MHGIFSATNIRAAACFAMFSLAKAARDSLLLCGPLIFKHGAAAEVAAYTSGMTSLVKLMARIEVVGVGCNMKVLCVCVCFFRLHFNMLVFQNGQVSL